MSSRTAERSLSEHCRKVFPERSEHSLSSHASPPRIGTWPSGRSLSMKSMNSGTPASVALPERSSRGITRSTSIRTVSHSWGVKNVGAYGEEGGACSAVRANPAARAASAGVHLNAAVTAAMAIAPTASRRDAVAVLARRHRRIDLTTHLRDQCPEGLLHVFHLQVFVVGKLPVEAEHGDSPFVHDVGIDLAVAAVVGNHLAAAGEAHVGAVIAAIVLLELFPVAAARWVAVNSAHEAVVRHVGAAPHLDVIAAREVELLVVQPPRHVDVHSSHTVVIMRDVIHHLRDEARDVGAGRVREILAHRPAAVREPVGK